MSKLDVAIQEFVKKHEEEVNRNRYTYEKNKLLDLVGDDLAELMKTHKCFIAGGAITSIFTGAEINDLDVYFRDEKSCVAFVKHCWEDSIGRVNMLTKKSILMRSNDQDVQLIHFDYFNTAQDIFNTFDFTACMGAFDFSTEQFVLHDDFMKHNSQRILKFNKETAFPIISLLRVQKYNKKQYSISKPEFLRIAMKCMTLKINTVEELKNHLGGMYGINYDKIIKFEDGEEFSLDKVIDKIADITHSEDYFKKPVETTYDDLQDVIDTIQNKSPVIVELKGRIYRIGYNNSLKALSERPASYQEISAQTFFENKKFYKFVEKENENTYRSHYDKTFTYEIGQGATAKGDYLYFNEQSEFMTSSYKGKGSLIEATIHHDDFVRKDGTTILTKTCKVIREVPKEEYEKWTKQIDNDEFENIYW
jgi:hypothetical protein